MNAPSVAADDVAVHRIISMPAECSCPRRRSSNALSLFSPFVEAIIPKDEALVLVFKNKVAKDATLD